MTDDEDRTQEIRREPDQYRPDAGRGDDTAVFGPPPTQRPQPEPGPEPGPAYGAAPGAGAAPDQASATYPPPGGGYRPAQPTGGYGPAQPAAPYGGYQAPMLPADRGSGGFPAAIVGAVVATLLAVATSFGAYQILRHHASIDSRKLPGFLTYRMDLLPWPSGHSGDITTAFVVGVLIVLVITLLLMMAATMSTRAGTGGFAVFLAGWMATVIAGGVARPVAGAIARHGSYPDAVWQTDLNTGVLWGVLFGWIAALVLVLVHAMRRKPVAR